MIPRRNAEGWRDFGPLTWKIDRSDNHGDRSTSTWAWITWTGRWSFDFKLTRPWKETA